MEIIYVFFVILIVIADIILNKIIVINYKTKIAAKHELGMLFSEKKFLINQLRSIPESATLTKMSINSRIKIVNEEINALS